MSETEPIPPTSSVTATQIPISRKTSLAANARRNNEKALNILLSAIPDRHLLSFHDAVDARSLWKAIKARLEERSIKKMQKNRLKQQFETFTMATIFGDTLGLDELDFDDLYNNLKVYEHELKGVSNSNSQNIAFLSTEVKGSTLKQSTAEPAHIPKGYTQAISSKVPTAPNCASHSDEIICSFFAQQASMPTTHDDEDLLQIDEDAMEEIDIRWQVAMITARIRKFMRKTGRPIDLKPKNGITFDKSKIECFNCQKLGHFARECRFAKYQENRANGRQEKKTVAIEDSNSKALVATDNNEDIDWTKEFDAEPVTYAMMALTGVEQDDWSMEFDAEHVHFGQDGLGDFDWSNKADDAPVSLALMATNSEVPYCSKCSKSYKLLLENYQKERDNFQRARTEILGYQMSLESLEVMLKTHEKNEYAWGDKYEQMEYDLKIRDLKLEEKQKELDQALKERDDFKVKLEKWSNASVLQNEVLNKQRYVSDKSCIGFGIESSNSMESDISSGDETLTDSTYENFKREKAYKAVPPPTGTIIPPRANVSFTGIDELAIRNKVVNQEKTKSSQSAIDRNKVIIEDWVDSDDEETDVSESQKETAFNSENSETSFENRSPNSQNSVGQESRTKGLGNKGGKLCFVCYSPNHLIKDCNLHERTFQHTQTHKPKGTQGSRETRPVWNNIQRVNHSNFSRNSRYPHQRRSFIPSAVLTRDGLISTARPTITQTVPSKSTANVTYQGTARSRVPQAVLSRSTDGSYLPWTPHRPQRPKKIVKSIWVKKGSTVGSQAVLPQTVKKSAMINPKQTWKPKGNYLDSVNRGNGSYTLKQFDERQGTRLSDFKEFKGGYVGFWKLILKVEEFRKRNIKDSCLDFEKLAMWRSSSFISYLFITICDRSTMFPSTDKECLSSLQKFSLLMKIWTPQQNGVAERKNRTFIEAARTMLADSLLPIQFWAEAVNTACYVLNRVLFDGKSEEGYLLGYSTTAKEIKGKGKKNMLIQNEEEYLVDDVEDLVDSNYCSYCSAICIGGYGLLHKKCHCPSEEQALQMRLVWEKEHVDSTFTLSTANTPLKGMVHTPTDSDDDTPKGTKKSLSMHLADESWVDAMLLEELLQFKVQGGKGCYVILPCKQEGLELNGFLENERSMNGVTIIQEQSTPSGTGIDRKGGIMMKYLQPVAGIDKQSDSFWAFAIFHGFTVYQMDVKVHSLVWHHHRRDHYPQVWTLEHKAASTPIEAHKSLGKDEEGEDVDVHLYSQSKGFSSTCLSKVFRYLKHQPNLGLWYPKDSPFHLEAFSDSDYAGDNHDRRSTSGGCQYLGRRLVSWQAEQSYVANLSSEAEICRQLQVVVLGHISNGTPFLMYPRFVQLFLNKQLEGVDRPQDFIPSVSLPSKVFTFMRKHSTKFSCRITPLTPSMLEVVTALAAEEEPSTSPHSRAASSARDAQGSPTQSAAHSQRTASVQGTASFHSTANSQGTAEIQGDEGLLDVYALNREVKRLKRQTLSQAKLIQAKRRMMKHKKKVSSVKLGRNKEEGTLSEEHYVQEEDTVDPFFDNIADEDAADLERKSDETEEVNIEEKEASNVKSEKTEELDLETTQSTARQGTITPRTLNFEDEAVFKPTPSIQEGMRIWSIQTQPQTISQGDDPKGKGKRYLLKNLKGRKLTLQQIRAGNYKYEEVAETVKLNGMRRRRKKVEGIKEAKPKIRVGHSRAQVEDGEVDGVLRNYIRVVVLKLCDKKESLRRNYHDYRHSEYDRIVINYIEVFKDYYEHIPPMVLLDTSRMLDNGREVEVRNETTITLIHLFILWTTKDGGEILKLLY
ncbi:ribonuclease H-like domain-containing protein [Tanacetum coccineum]